MLKRLAGITLALCALLAFGWSPVQAATTITTVAGTGAAGFGGDGGPATSALLNGPTDVDALHTLTGGGFVIADQGNCRIRRVSINAGEPSDTGNISTVAGSGTCGAALAAGATGSPSYDLSQGLRVSATADGGFLVADFLNSRVHEFLSGSFNTVAGTGICNTTPPANGLAALSANLCLLTAVAAHPSQTGRYLIAEVVNRPSGARIYEVSAGNITTVAGGGCPTEPVSPTALQLCIKDPQEVAYTRNNTGFYFVDRQRQLVWNISGTSASREAGQNNTYGFAGDGGGITLLYDPYGIDATADGGFVLADTYNCRVRRWIGGIANTLAGLGANAGCGTNMTAPLGDEGPSTAASLYRPFAVAAFGGGILIAESQRNRIRLIDRTSITSGPSGYVTSPNATFTYASTEPDPVFQCHRDSVPYADCPPEGQTYTGLREGMHSFEVADIKSPAEPTPARTTWVVDLTPPSAADLLEPADGAGGLSPTPTLAWAPSADASGIDHYELTIDGERQPDVQAAACTAERCSAQPAALSEAEHSWQVRAVDRAGLGANSSTRRFVTGSPPAAALTVSPNPALQGRPVTFDGSGSTDANGPITRYEWDLDGDGSFELETGAAGVATRVYDQPRTFDVSLRVTDGVGLTAVATQTLRVTSAAGAGQLGVTIENGTQYTNKPDVTLFLRFPAATTQVLVSNDGGFLAPVAFAPAAQLSWRLDSSGPERLPKTVYLRVLAGGIVLDTYTDDIILDERPPVVERATIAPASVASARAAAARKWRIKVRATDSNSGVGFVQVTASKKRPGRLIAYKRTFSVRSAKRPAFLRARDRAGNYSRWRRLR